MTHSRAIQRSRSLTGRSRTSSRSPDDFRLAGLPYVAWQANAQGIVTLQFGYNKQSISDDVTLQLVKLDGSQNSVAVSGTVVATPDPNG